MIEFNPDGSIKIPDAMRKQKEEKNLRMKIGHCVTVQKEVVSFTAPKKCHLTLKLSEKIINDEFIPRIYGYFNENSEVPSKLTKNQDNEHVVVIGSSFSRCRDCTNFINRIRIWVEI
jgi:hypothetical protein